MLSYQNNKYASGRIFETTRKCLNKKQNNFTPNKIFLGI